ncbi:MAG: histidinol-phosphatase HisJ family protein [Candidatus Goldbacteria bacterium]|nr:histidinol-phosphatase HisJ family protein [Candidatus Goldiibacteriota bacterium]
MYNLCDLHLHSKFSWDAKLSIDEIIKEAQINNFKYIGLTEHIDFWDDHTQNYLKFNYDGYTESIEKARELNLVNICKGVEVGEIHVYPDRFNKFLEGKQFDLILGSIHTIGDYTPVFDEYFEQYKNVKDAYKAYLEEEYELVKYGGFDVAAHITFMHRTGGKFFKDFNYNSFKNEIDDILKLMISKKIGLEINTSGMRHFANGPVPDFDIVEAYIKLGGDIITVGSDAHSQKDIFYGIKETFSVLEKLGVKEITFFKNRKPEKIKIKNEEKN